MVENHLKHKKNRTYLKKKKDQEAKTPGKEIRIDKNRE